jgi:hypothetical protein
MLSLGACRRPLSGHAEAGGYVFNVQQINPEADKTEGMVTLRVAIGLHDGQGDPLRYGISDRNAFQQRLYHLSYQLKDEVHLEQGGEKFPCVLYHFERAQDLHDQRVVVMAFEVGAPLFSGTSLIIKSDLFANEPVQIKL